MRACVCIRLCHDLPWLRACVLACMPLRACVRLRLRLHRAALPRSVLNNAEMMSLDKGKFFSKFLAETKGLTGIERSVRAYAYAFGIAPVAR